MKAEKRKSLALPRARLFQDHKLHGVECDTLLFYPVKGGLSMTNFIMVLGCLSLYLIAGFIVLFISVKLEQVDVKRFRRGF
jgi:hypothetical protein